MLLVCIELSKEMAFYTTQGAQASVKAHEQRTLMLLLLMKVKHMRVCLL
jgi:hypothetical protein